jgi:hypothetical protein
MARSDERRCSDERHTTEASRTKRLVMDFRGVRFLD